MISEIVYIKSTKLSHIIIKIESNTINNKVVTLFDNNLKKLCLI